MTAHQRIIREAEALREPRPIVASLEGYEVGVITKQDAEKIILRYEWLGAIGRASLFAGLYSPVGEIHGAACFGWGPSGPIRKLIGEPALCLERGACVHYAPRNAASFLITYACRLMETLTGTAIFFAYGDPEAGEYGGVYQAANWVYLGQGLDGKAGRSKRSFVLAPGLDPSNPANWRTTRELRRDGRRLGFAEAREQGWIIAKREAKHVYATHVGRERKAWRRTMPTLAYPAPRPELKLKPLQSHSIATR